MNAAENQPTIQHSRFMPFECAKSGPCSDYPPGTSTPTCLQAPLPPFPTSQTKARRVVGKRDTNHPLSPVPTSASLIRQGPIRDRVSVKLLTWPPDTQGARCRRVASIVHLHPLALLTYLKAKGNSGNGQLWCGVRMRIDGARADNVASRLWRRGRRAGSGLLE